MKRQKEEKEKKLHFHLFGRSPKRLSLLFSAAVFLIIFVTMLLITVGLEILLAFGVFPDAPSAMVITYILAPSLLIGTGFSRFFGRRFFRSVEKVKSAMQKVAQGDFSVKLPENSRITELRDMSHLFNVMTGELGSMEIIHNDFVRNVSHEFKTPLTAIEGYATLLSAPDVPEEKRILCARKIVANSQRLATLTGNVLALSQLENQMAKPAVAPFSLDEQLRKVVLLFEEQWTAKNIEIDMDEAPLEYVGNEELLFQVWQNIIGNALKFTPEGGHIVIRYRREPAKVLVSVQDDGAGIPAEAQAHIFEKFYQADKSHAARGNGLGLALVKRIVELHGGTVWVDSVPGHGATFTVELP